METKSMKLIKKAKEGDILVETLRENDPLGNIFIFKGLSKDNTVLFHCYYDVCRRTFNLQERPTVHLGVVNEHLFVRKATPEEEYLLMDVMSDHNYFYDEIENEVVKDDDREIGQPVVEFEESKFGNMHISHLSGKQQCALRILVDSWN